MQPEGSDRFSSYFSSYSAPMVATPATLALEKAGIAFRVRQYEHDPEAVARGLPYGEEAAEALGLPAGQVFKTILVVVDGSPGVVIAPVSARIALKRAAQALGGRRASLMDPSDAERITGYVVGGISPVGQKRRLPTVLDAKAMEYAHVAVSAGRRGVDMELTPADLVAVTGATVRDLTM